MSEEDDLHKRIEALEQENRALRETVNRPGKRNVIVVTEGTYQGHPTITFEAGGRPFTLGLRKLSVVLYCSEWVKIFVSRHKGEIKDWEIVRGNGGDGEGEARSDQQI
jgi:hypothetical protein